MNGNQRTYKLPGKSLLALRKSSGIFEELWGALVVKKFNLIDKAQRILQSHPQLDCDKSLPQTVLNFSPPQVA